MSTYKEIKARNLAQQRGLLHVGRAGEAGSDVGLVGIAAGKYTGLYRSHDDGTWSLFDGLDDVTFGDDQIDSTGQGFQLAALNLSRVNTARLDFTGAANKMTLPEALSSAFEIKSGTNSYFRAVTTVGEEMAEFDQDTLFNSDATFAGTLRSTGTGLEFDNLNSGVNAITVPGALADALSVRDGTGAMLTFQTETASRRVAVSAPLDIQGLRLGVTAVTADTALTAAHNIVNVTTAAATVTLTLPSAATHAGRVYKIAKVDSGAGRVDIVPTGSDVIDGDASAVELRDRYDYTQVTSHGVAWFLH